MSKHGRKQYRIQNTKNSIIIIILQNISFSNVLRGGKCTHLLDPNDTHIDFGWNTGSILRKVLPWIELMVDKLLSPHLKKSCPQTPP